MPRILLEGPMAPNMAPVAPNITPVARNLREFVTTVILAPGACAGGVRAAAARWQ